MIFVSTVCYTISTAKENALILYVAAQPVKCQTVCQIKALSYYLGTAKLLENNHTTRSSEILSLECVEIHTA